jgi:hypothetical protein
MTGIISDVFRPQETSKQTRTKQCNALALPALLYGSGNWNITARGITAVQMKYSRITAVYRLYNKHRDCRRTQYSPNFGQNFRNKEETGCNKQTNKQNAPQ